MVAYRTDSDHIEIGYLGSNVKVTVTENVAKNDEKDRFEGYMFQILDALAYF